MQWDKILRRDRITYTGDEMRRSSEVSGKRPRRDLDHPSLLGPLPPGYNTPTSFRIANEGGLRKTSVRHTQTADGDTYGVNNLQDTIHEPTFPQGQDEPTSSGDARGGRRRSTLKPTTQPHTRDSSQASSKELYRENAGSSPARSSQEDPSPPSISHSLTSLSLDSQMPLSSLPSTPKSTSNRSLRPSDEESIEDGASPASASSEDDDNEPPFQTLDSTPQLIMPSIKMPSRRPFTERGKAMGRLKILIAGDSNVGKTSLIKSIVQQCEDIVHVDPLSSSPSNANHLRIRKIRGHGDIPRSRSTQCITEVYASTKPYPSWWSDIEDVKALRRRKSLGDTVLERNLCFVDTPGYNSGISRIESMQLVLKYIETQLTKPFSASTATEGDIVGLLSGSGGSQVDVVFYLVAQGLKDEDITFIQRLAGVTNVIPLIAKSDMQSPEESELVRRSIDKLQHSGLQFYSLRSDFASSKSTLSYNVCSATADDDDNMDASMLMSSEYVQPLITSELALLVQNVFQPDNIACLRHLAARKLVHAQASRLFSTPAMSLRSPLNTPHDQIPDAPMSSAAHPDTLRSLVPYNNGLSPYIQARMSDHTQQEEKLAQVRLARWATDLQRSLQNERERYKAIARGERALWLNEKLEENMHDDALSRSTLTQASGQNGTLKSREAGRVTSAHGMLDANDPLGLLRWNEVVRKRGWVAIKIVGSFGVLGAIAVWVARTWGFENRGFSQWSWI